MRAKGHLFSLWSIVKIASNEFNSTRLNIATYANHSFCYLKMY